MARYKDTDEILRKLDEFYITAIVQQKHDDVPEDHKKHWKGIQSGINYARNTIIESPAADVVPRSEIIRWRLQLEAVLEEIPETKREVAMEIFEEIEKAIYHTAFNVPESVIRFRNKIAELKKKYTEG